MSGTRPAVLSGTWYPSEPSQLIQAVDGYLAAADPTQAPAGRPRLAVAPHAGYVYSGETAGKTLGLLAPWAIGRIVILAPNHRAYLEQIALSGADGYATPLGIVPVDTAAVARLAACPAFAVDDAAHANEHAIEIQLPFLQRVWPTGPPPVVPLLVPHLDDEGRRLAAAALAGILQADTLLLVSTDFTHYGASFDYLPFTEDIPASLEKLDAGAILRILAADPEGLLAFGRESRITMCGLEAAALALSSATPADHEGALIAYCRSGDRDADYSLSVSYAGILISSGQEEPPTTGRKGNDD